MKRRVDEEALVQGRMQFIDDVEPDGTLHLTILGSDVAHGIIEKIDLGGADAVSGVAAVFTGQDLLSFAQPLVGTPPGWTNYPLAVERTRYFGEPVVAILAESRAIGEEARRRIRVTYQSLPVVLDARQAIAPDAPLLHEAQGTNVIFADRFSFGSVDDKLRAAEHRVSLQARWRRNSGNPLETGGVVAVPSPDGSSLDVFTNMQAATFQSASIAQQVGVELHNLRVHRQHTGGSFGSKVTFGKFVILASLLARRTGRSVKFVEDRMEHLRASSSHGPDRMYDVEAAVGSDGRIQALRVTCLDNFGAYVERRPGASVRPLASLPGCYDITDLEYDLTVVATNKSPQGSYRGYGPNVHSFVLERLVDTIADELGLDPVAVRRVNYIPETSFPYPVATGKGWYDSGRYEECLDVLLREGDHAAWRRAQDEARRDGRLLGIGIATTVEPGGFFDNALYGVLDGSGPVDIPESATLSVGADGVVHVRVGYGSEGQAHDTLAALVVSRRLGVDPETVLVEHVSSTEEPESFGPGGSRMAVALAGAVDGAVDELVEQIQTVVADEWGCDSSAVTVGPGGVRERGGPRHASLADVARLTESRTSAPLASRYVWRPDRGSLPLDGGSYLTTANAAHQVVVEVDPVTGEVKILDYVIVHDCGTVLDPTSVAGQIQGGVAQGIGAVLNERYEYDNSGRLLTDSWQTYLVPELFDVPPTRKIHLSTPSPFTSSGQKGTGEGAMNTTPAALANAITDALRPYGVTIDSVPVTPMEISEAIQRSRRLSEARDEKE